MTINKVVVYQLIITLLLLSLDIRSQTNDDCMGCHEDKTLTKIQNGKQISLFVNNKIIGNSVHSRVKCVSCHTDAAVEDFPHPEELKEVNCGSCHKDAMKKFTAGIHGQSLKLNSEYAPDCKECHGKHDVISKNNPKSRTYKMNIPMLCGKCHREGAPVARIYTPSEHNILENYSEGIHGIGLFKKGLIVSATCNDCHENHLVLPHTSPNSSINSKNIAATCMKCHTRIEDVHKKVIDRQLWEKKTGEVPACTECHPPHKVTIQKITETISDKPCIKCHVNENPIIIRNSVRVSLKINPIDIANSVHKNISCTKCHTRAEEHIKQPISKIPKVDCAICHDEVSNIYIESGHGQEYFKKNPNAPYCTDCHGTHLTKSRYDDTSPTYRGLIPDLCGNCHKSSGQSTKNKDIKVANAFTDYSTSVHGKGLKEKGLLVSAVCTDCHTSHHILNDKDARSSVYPQNIPLTCAKCHKSVYQDYIKSDHSITLGDDKKYPSCSDCHTSHVNYPTGEDQFMKEVTRQCGSCHSRLADTYFETYHGKAYRLGYLKAAKCSDCHGAHKILKVDNPNSSVGYLNIVETCKKCHANATLKFTGYLTHATHNDNKVLFYTFWGMTSLLLFVFGFFGLHTLLWIPRSIKEARRKKLHKVASIGKGQYYRRFSKSQRVTHIFVIVSFIILAFTGMLLKFSHMKWASILADLLGGVYAAGRLHRFAAIITFGYFAYHIYSLIKQKKLQNKSYKQFIFGKDSLMFNKQDVKDFIATIKWFVGKGPRPQYGRWTYWEKFDYMAVFWGVAVIGFSGLILWFPEFFTKFFPGWFINVAQIIHSDEALLAVGFIFTIHFFNTHLRPEAFPMDTVIFTGHVPVEEYKNDRSREFNELESTEKLKDFVVETDISPSWLKFVKTFGYIFLSFGIILILLIIYSMIFGKY